jgi:hypothetical protein
VVGGFYGLGGGGAGCLGGWVDDMYKMTVGQGVVYAYEAYEAKQRVALVRVPFYFRNFGLIPDRQSFCTYLYYFHLCQSIWQHSPDLRLGLGEEVRSPTSWDMKLACGVWYQCYSDAGINTCRRNPTDCTCCAIFKHPFSPTRKYFRPKLLNCILLHGRDGKRVLRNTDNVGDERTVN